MEFPFDIDLLLPDKISKFNNKLQIKGKRSYINDKNKRAQLLMLIDRIGAASAKAQDLHVAVTTGEKFIQSEHEIYLMKENSDGKSVVVGILKMGSKKLFLINRDGTQNETFPLCVLDFYVHESMQRKGYGKLLFEFMLKEENILPHLLAIDRPSSKFLAFLRKHYNLCKTIPQVNHFIIFEGFFKNRCNQLTRRKSTDCQFIYEKDNTKGEKQILPLLDAQHQYSKRLSYPYSTGNEIDNKDNLQSLNAQVNMYNSRYQKKPAVSTSETSWHGDASASSQSCQFESPEATIHSKLTPDGSCALHLAEDSTMKIFGVPSAWMQASGR